MNNDSQVILHLGLHKTATGTLQRQFFPACTDLNLLTTKVTEMKSFVSYVTHTDPLYFDKTKAKAMIEHVLDMAKPNMLSNESFSGPPYAGVIEGGLDHREPILKNLKAVFPAAKAVLVLRRQDALARSMYRQYLKSGGTRKITRFYGMEEPYKPGLFSLDRFKFSPYVNAVYEAFPQGVLLLVFEDFVVNQEQFLKKLVDFVGVKLPKLELRRENATTLGPAGMEFSRYLNYLFRSQLNPAGMIPAISIGQGGQKRRIRLVKILHDQWPGRGGRHKIGAIARIADQIFEQVRDDNRLLDEILEIGAESLWILLVLIEHIEH